MPIPQLSRKTKSPQQWRSKKKKYYLKKSGSSSGGSIKRSRTGRRFSKKRLSLFFGLSSFNLIKILIGLIFLFSLFVFILIAWLSHDLPDPNRLSERQIAQSTKIYDRTGETILYEIHGEEKRTLVNLEEIPTHLKNATIVIEDKDFYKHGGFSLWAMFRTAITNVLFGKKAGGSTLTQQFIKNSVLTSEKTYTRKIKELILAYRMEKKFSKDEILQMYFNEIPYGSTAYGIEAASMRYFGKQAKNINLAEATILAALPQAPSRYSPYGPNKDLLIARQHYILDLMVKQGYVSKEEAIVAKGIELKFREQADNITAPHFVMYVKEQLAEKYGEKMIEQGGLKIYTTLDLYKQEIAEEVIEEKMAQNGEPYQATNAALVSLDPKTGQILAMVGSRDYFNDEIDGQVNVALQPRQPGSSFKPFVYASSFIEGYTPDTILYDVVTNFSTDPDEPYEPHNYDSEEHGPVTIRKALAGSLNIPAVKAIYLTGIDNVLDLAQDFGYTTLSDRSRFGLSLVLGGGEIKLLEHTSAYGALAREGILSPATTILKVEDKDGKTIEEYKEKNKKVVDTEIARLINNVLSDNSARAYAFGEDNYLTLGPRPVAAKTGTTNDYRDAWTLGYTPSIVTGVWVGNNDNTPMKKGAGGSVMAAPIWHDYMNRVLGDTPIEYFKEPEATKTGIAVLDGEEGGDTIVKIDKYTGLLATEYTPPNFIEEKKFKQTHCILYYLDKDDPRGDKPSKPQKDPQFELWEERVLAWAEKQNIVNDIPPTEYDNIHVPKNKPSVLIESPANNQAIMNPLLSVAVKASAPRGVNRVEYYINDNLLATAHGYPFYLEKNINFLNNGFYGLAARVCDDADNCSEQKIEFNLILDEQKGTEEIGVTWNSPTGEIVLDNNNFPMELLIDLTNPSQISKITVYLKNENGDQTEIAFLANPESTLAKIIWPTPPRPGAYSLLVKALGWNGQSTESKEIKITIKEPTEN